MRRLICALQSSDYDTQEGASAHDTVELLAHLKPKPFPKYIGHHNIHRSRRDNEDAGLSFNKLPMSGNDRVAIMRFRCSR